MCIIMVRARWSLLEYCHHTSRRCMFRFSLLGKSIDVWLSFRSSFGADNFSVCDKLLPRNAREYWKRSFQEVLEMRRKNSCKCTCVCKRRVVFSLSAIYYVKGNRALGNSILRNFVHVTAKCNNYQHSFIAHTIRDSNSSPNRFIEEQSVKTFKMVVMPCLEKRWPRSFIMVNIYLTLAPCLIS